MKIELEDFSGPFDLLLHLIRVKKMDIYEVNIKEIIDEYIDFINSLDENNLDETSEYLVLASELIHLKSRMLVNKDSDEEVEEDSYNITDEEDLRNRLIEYERYKSMCETFRLLEENRQDYYTKIPENLQNYVEDDEKIINSDVTLNDLLNAFLEMQKRVSLERPLTTKIMKKEYSVKARIKEIRNLLKIKKQVKFEELFDILSKDVVVVTFLSLLDMSKNAEIVLKQDKIFSTIVIESVR